MHKWLTKFGEEVLAVCEVVAKSRRHCQEYNQRLHQVVEAAYGNGGMPLAVSLQALATALTVGMVVQTRNWEDQGLDWEHPDFPRLVTRTLQRMLSLSEEELEAELADPVSPMDRVLRLGKVIDLASHRQSRHG